MRELETVKASVTRIVDQMDKKLDNSLEVIRDTIADTVSYGPPPTTNFQAVSTVSQYLEAGMAETRTAMTEAVRDMMVRQGSHPL